MQVERPHLSEGGGQVRNPLPEAPLQGLRDVRLVELQLAPPQPPHHLRHSVAHFYFGLSGCIFCFK